MLEKLHRPQLWFRMRFEDSEIVYLAQTCVPKPYCAEIIIDCVDLSYYQLLRIWRIYFKFRKMSHMLDTCVFGNDILLGLIKFIPT